MYTQCPECATVFRVSADALRVAQGTVRCGICSSSFNAIEFLNEQPIPRQGDEPAHEDTITVEEVPGNEFIELSAAAGDPPPEFISGEQEAPAEQADQGLYEAKGADLEFHGSVQDLERLFVTVEPRPLWPVAAAGPAGAAGQDTGEDDDFERAIGAIAEGEFSGIEVREERLPGGLEDDDTHPGRIAAILAFPSQNGPAAQVNGDQPPGMPEPEAEDAQQAAGSAADEGEAVEDPDRTDEYPVLVLEGHGDDSGAPADDEPEPVADEDEDEDATASAETGPEATATGEPDGEAGEAPEADAVREPAAGDADPDAQPPAAEDATLLLLIPEELRREHAESAASAFEPAAEPGPATRRWPMVAVAALLAVLATQAIHFWRHDLSRNPAVGPWLMRAYSQIGVPLTPPVDLSAFELRQLGAASDGLQAGRIKLRASIVNRAAFAQPLPLIRLSLQDRFGSTIATRDLDATEYLPGGAAPASGLLGPSQRADAEVVFVDPGRDAVGFELDVCLREAAGVRCSAAAEGRP